MKITRYKTTFSKNELGYVNTELSVDLEKSVKGIGRKYRNKLDAKTIADTFDLTNSCTEELYVVALNEDNSYLGIYLASKGLVDRTFVSTKEIMKFLLLIKAKKFFLMHNHVSGNCTQSREDVISFERIKLCLSYFTNIEIIDNIIVSIEDVLSFREDTDGYFEEKEYFQKNTLEKYLHVAEEIYTGETFSYPLDDPENVFSFVRNSYEKINHRDMVVIPANTKLKPNGIYKIKDVDNIEKKQLQKTIYELLLKTNATYFFICIKDEKFRYLQNILKEDIFSLITETELTDTFILKKDSYISLKKENE